MAEGLKLPPPRSKGDLSLEEVLARSPVDTVVYGHIHGVDLQYAYDETFDVGGRPIRYVNGSCDHVRCTPILLGEFAD